MMMIREDIPLYKLDLEGNSTFNKVDHEYMFRRTVKNNNIVIPPKAPFYQKSFKMFDKTGKLLVENEDYEFYGIMGKLTQFTGKPVGLFVRILKDEITEWYVDYQVVGNFDKISNEILNMLHSIYEDDRYVIYDNIQNKPLWFVPEIHQHDLTYDIYGFTDLARELSRIADLQATMVHASDVMVTVLRDRLNVYITGYKKVLMDLLNSHIANQQDAHGTDKTAIGLGNVDNIRVATLDETLEGLRDDLTITPYNAAKAAEAAAGRNEKLFPSGSLPLLRYGSDTFIPPTISGSFEGLGGISRRTGAVVETDGTLLVLQHRNNGKVSGLYFTRCQNWQSQDAIYDFTAYMYTHPTATAAGAVLDTIINGSNKYVMVVGDRQKNMWWWCETKGTLNPDRHILIRLSGEWISEDAAMMEPVSDVYNGVGQAQVIADKDYANNWAIIQPYGVLEFLKRRPSQCPDYPAMGQAAWGSGQIVIAGFSINVVSGKSGTIKRSRVSYTHPVFGNFNDFYFSQWFPKAETINGKRVVTSCTAQYNPPLASCWMFRSPMAYWLNNGNLGEYSFRLEYQASESSGTGADTGDWLAWRGTLKISRSGNDVLTTIVPAPGSDKLYTIDIRNRKPGVQEWDDYYKYVVARYNPSTLDQTGSSIIAGQYIQFSQGAGNVSFPPAYSVIKADYLESAEKLLMPPSGATDIALLYDRKTFTETNPLGMATLFSSQRLLSADTDDYTQAGIMAVQSIGAVGQWYFRYMPYLNANWEHTPQTQNSSFRGKTFLHYPFTPKGLICSLGQQVFMGTQMPIAGRQNKDNQKKILGATCDTTFDGSPPPIDSSKPYFGDGLLTYECEMKVNDGVLAVTPKILIDLIPGIKRVIFPLFKGVGLTEAQILETWSVHLALNPTGEWHAVWMAFGSNAPNITFAAVVTTLTPGGTLSNKNGIPFYNDANITALCPVKTYTRVNEVASNYVQHPRYQYAGSSLPLFIATPYRGIVNGQRDLSAYHVVTSTTARWATFGGGTPGALQLDIRADGSEIIRIGNGAVQEWGTEQSTTVSPYYGIGSAASGMNVFEGAAIGAEIYNQNGTIFDSYLSGAVTGTPVIGMSNILTPQYTVYFQKIQNVILSGKMYDIPATYIDIMAQDPNPANKVYYIYLYYDNGQAKYVIAQSVRPESSSQSLIAKVTCGPTQIDNIIPYNRFSIDGASISANRQGSAILASSGSLYEVGNTTNILLDGDFIP